MTTCPVHNNADVPVQDPGLEVQNEIADHFDFNAFTALQPAAPDAAATPCPTANSQGLGQYLLRATNLPDQDSEPQVFDSVYDSSMVEIEATQVSLESIYGVPSTDPAARSSDPAHSGHSAALQSDPISVSFFFWNNANEAHSGESNSGHLKQLRLGAPD